MTAPVDVDLSEYAIAFHRDGYFVRDDVVSDEAVQRFPDFRLDFRSAWFQNVRAFRRLVLSNQDVAKRC